MARDASVTSHEEVSPVAAVDADRNLGFYLTNVQALFVSLPGGLCKTIVIH